uniref:Uncharacterized protein n=1 Tax=Triticum urartu TaxID=4572 RepID=A0A8R7TXY0_TRIUA
MEPRRLRHEPIHPSCARFPATPDAARSSLHRAAAVRAEDDASASTARPLCFALDCQAPPVLIPVQLRALACPHGELRLLRVVAASLNLHHLLQVGAQGVASCQRRQSCCSRVVIGLRVLLQQQIRVLLQHQSMDFPSRI